MLLLSLNSTYWNLVFQARCLGRDLSFPLRLNSTYWNLVFQGPTGIAGPEGENVWTPLTGIWYFRRERMNISTRKMSVWTPLTGIWYFRKRPHLIRAAVYSVWTPLTGIWYFRLTIFPPWRKGLSFELHLLESGISGEIWNLYHCDGHFSLNSTYWNLVFQGSCPRPSHRRIERLNSTYWNLVFQGTHSAALTRKLCSLNSTYWNLVFQVRDSSSMPHRSCSFELHLLESGISGYQCRDCTCKR